MHQLYMARNAVEARFLQGLLAEEEIEAVVQGELLDEMPVVAGTALPTVWVREGDLERAQPIVDEYDQRLRSRADGAEQQARPTWKCPQYGELIEEQFTRCWHCNAPKPGN